MKSYPSILVVDDDQGLVNMLESFLEEESYQVTKAYDGNSAIDLLEMQYRPDLIVLDIILPGMDGFKVLDFVRHRYDIPVIILTAKRDITTLSDAFTRGADDFITKPFSQRVLLARIKAKLRRIGPIYT
ncbi:response regulator transcription factor [Chloroflexota bacterium]